MVSRWVTKTSRCLGAINGVTGIRLSNRLFNGISIVRHPAVGTIVVVFGSALLLLSRLDFPLLEPEEGRYAEIPRQMLCQNRFLVPILDGQDYLDKPPLLYWSVMGCFRLFDVDVWSARLVPCLAAWLTVIVVYFWVRRVTGLMAAFIAAAILTLNGDFAYRAPMLTMNGMLGLLVTLALATGYWAGNTPTFRSLWWIISALACAAGVMTKGPIAIALVLPPLAVLCWINAETSWQAVRRLGSYVIVVLVFAGPWFVIMTMHDAGFADYFFWKHHLERFASPFDHAKLWWFYLPQLVIGFFPWSLIVIQMIVGFICNVRRFSIESLESFALFAGMWGLLLFSMAGSKRPAYLVPIWPALAIAVGVFLHRTLESRAVLLGFQSRGWMLIGVITLTIIGAGILLGLPNFSARFSIPQDVLVQAAKTSCPIRTVFCFPHNWESVRFYLQRRDVRVFNANELTQLIDALRDSPASVVVIQSGLEWDRFCESLPSDFYVELCGGSGLATVAIVRHN